VHPRQHIAAAVATALALAGTTAALAGSPPANQPIRGAQAATAHAAAYASDDQTGKRRAFVTVSGSGSRSSSPKNASTAVTASTGNYRGRATAAARVDQVSLLNGMVTADTASVRATAAGGASVTSGRVTNLVVSGNPKGSPTQRTTYDLQGYGKLIVLDQPGRAVVALTAKLSRPYGPYAAGTVLQVAYASASASDGTPPPAVPPPRPHKPQPAPPKPGPAHRTPAPSTPNTPAKPARRRKPSRTHVLLTSKGFVFPVYGPHNFTDTFGAFRADTGFHEGNDIFALAGTPLVAVCDGSLNRVGTLPISGNRLWVKCTKTGDAFFYAHLSAFATDTRDGLHVKAGQVIGFLGSTGDAERTPPHLHFEVHPGDGPAVDPYPFLRAWESRRDVPAAAWVRENGQIGRQPGTLVVVRDFLSR
jgi:murein DD-endopeptidase MepM/ murein hydrolase activator NlpD